MELPQTDAERHPAPVTAGARGSAGLLTDQPEPAPAGHRKGEQRQRSFQSPCHQRGLGCGWAPSGERRLCTRILLSPVDVRRPKRLLCKEPAFVFAEGIIFFRQRSFSSNRKYFYPQGTTLRCGTDQHSVAGEEILETKDFYNSLKTEQEFGDFTAFQ